MAEKLADDILDAAAGRFGAARDAALGYRLAGHAGNRVDVRGIELPVFVRHPGHLACAGSHVRRGHVAARADIAAVGELLGEAAGDSLELFRVVVSGADRQSALGAAERNVDERAFEGHQRRQRLDLLLVDMGRVANAALHGKAVLAMHRAPAAQECVVAPPETHRETQLNDGIALADGFHQIVRNAERIGGPVEHAAYAGLEIGARSGNSRGPPVAVERGLARISRHCHDMSGVVDSICARCFSAASTAKIAGSSMPRSRRARAAWRT